VASTPDRVRIHYRRAEREDLYVQTVVQRTRDCVVTFLEHTPLPRPIVIAGRTALEPGAPAVWFTFPGARHDIGRFHLADGSFTGIYANILSPVLGVSGNEWWTTDQFLDIWLADGAVSILDEDELAAAERNGDIGPADAGRARAEATRLVAAFGRGEWPPPVVAEWPLERARALLGAVDTGR
jgi:predicted RNA-binding protein associated with RNAse of E/G family